MDKRIQEHLEKIKEKRLSLLRGYVTGTLHGRANMGRRLTHTEQEKIKRLRASGVSYRGIRRETGHGIGAISRVLTGYVYKRTWHPVKVGRARQGQRLGADELAQIDALAKEGLGPSQISIRVNRSYSTIQQYLAGKRKVTYGDVRTQTD